MSLFRGIDFENLEDGEYIQFFGVHMLSWGDIERATGIKPTIAFIEDDSLEKQIADLVAALEAALPVIQYILANGWDEAPPLFGTTFDEVKANELAVKALAQFKEE